MAAIAFASRDPPPILAILTALDLAVAKTFFSGVFGDPSCTRPITELLAKGGVLNVKSKRAHTA